MIKIPSRLILLSYANVLGFILADFFLVGLSISLHPWQLISIALALALINVLLRPIIRAILTPFIILTLGLLNIIINAGLLFLLDFLSQSLNINSLTDLIYATLVISFLNGLIIFTSKHAYK